MAIRYDKALNTEIRRVVHNYNQRIKRLKAEEKDLDIDFVKVSDIKNQFERRRDLLYELNKLESIRGDVSSIEKAMKQDVKRAKTRLTAEIKKVKVQEGTPRFTPMKSDRLRNLEARRMALNKDYSKLETQAKKRYKTQVNATIRPDPERLKKFYDNFFDMLFSNIYRSNYDPEQAEYIRKQLSKLTPEQLLTAYNERAVIHNIVDSYMQYNPLGKEFDEYGGYDEELANYVEDLYEAVDGIVEEYKKR